MRLYFIFMFVAVGLGSSIPVFGYPEMTRHGYVNCTTCHYSPSGGGILTAYGRELSGDLLSTWNREGENAFIYGILDTPEWLSLGGDFRSIYLSRNPAVGRSVSEFVYMQADAEAAVTFLKHWTFVGTLGYEEISGPYEPIEAVVARRHYLLFKPTDEWSFRAGKFQHAFGINVAEHILSTKRGLGWDQNTETYNIEAAWIGEKLDVFATGIFGRPDDEKLRRDQGVSLKGGYALGESYKVGMSYFYGDGATAVRHVYGVYGILGFTKRFFLLTETDFQFRSPRNTLEDESVGWVGSHRLDYEFIQGLHAYALVDYSKLDFYFSTTLRDSFGGGVQWFPRPHFELNATYLKQRQVSVADSYGDVFWFLFHVYL